MSDNSTAAFHVECTECDMEKASDKFGEVSTFVEKHHEHTGHDMEWINAEFESIEDMKTDWQVSCEHCSDDWGFTTLEEAEEFVEEHAEYTDHEITSKPTEVETISLNDLDGAGINNIITKLEDGYDDGVPEHVVYAIAAKKGFKIQETKTRIEELRNLGKVYEPKQGQFRTT